MANDASMSKSSSVVVYALICGLILFIALPHGLVVLERWRFLKRLRRAFESGTLQLRWPSEAVMYPCEIQDMCEVWVNSTELGHDEIDLPLLVGFTTVNDYPASTFDAERPAPSTNASPRRTLRDRLFHRMPTILPTTTTAQTNPPTTPRHLQGTLQIATLITMPSPRTSKLYNTSMITSCNLPHLAHPPITITPDGTCPHNGGVVEVSKPQDPDGLPPFPEEPFAFHIGVCAKPFTLDSCLLPPQPPSQPPPETERARRLPIYGIGYAGGAGVMIVQAPPRRSRDEESEEEWGQQTWMWRGF